MSFFRSAGPYIKPVCAISSDASTTIRASSLPASTRTNRSAQPAFQNHYEILALDRTASIEDIKLSFRQRRGMYFNMDVAKYRELQTAYTVLVIPETRALYDAQYANWMGEMPKMPLPSRGKPVKPMERTASEVATQAESDGARKNCYRRTQQHNRNAEFSSGFSRKFAWRKNRVKGIVEEGKFDDPKVIGEQIDVNGESEPLPPINKAIMTSLHDMEKALAAVPLEDQKNEEDGQAKPQNETARHVTHAQPMPETGHCEDANRALKTFNPQHKPLLGSRPYLSFLPISSEYKGRKRHRNLTCLRPKYILQKALNSWP